MKKHADLYNEIIETVKQVKSPKKTKVSREKSKKCKLLYPPKVFNRFFKEAFTLNGWKELKDNYTIEIPNFPIHIKGGFKQCDFFKEPIIVEVQFGKYAFMLYDLAKFQYFFNIRKIKLGVEILACHSLSRQMSSGVSYGEHLVYDLERLGKHFPAVPVMIMLIDLPLNDANHDLHDRKIMREAFENRQGIINQNIIKQEKLF